MPELQDLFRSASAHQCSASLLPLSLVQSLDYYFVVTMLDQELIRLDDDDLPVEEPCSSVGMSRRSRDTSPLWSIPHSQPGVSHIYNIPAETTYTLLPASSTNFQSGYYQSFGDCRRDTRKAWDKYGKETPDVMDCQNPSSTISIRFH